MTSHENLLGLAVLGWAFCAGPQLQCAQAALIAIQEAILTASGVMTNERFGTSVSLNADATTALVGAFQDDRTGTAYVLVRSGSTWSQQAKLTASDGGAWERFGWSVSLSSDGNTALVGAQGNTVAGTGAGSAYVFVRSGGSWTQQLKLTASDGATGDAFGSSVWLSIDGNTALVGAPGDDTPAGANAGSAYVFVRSGSTWSQQGKLTAGDGATGDTFGFSVCLNSDGNTALVGAAAGDYVTLGSTGTNAGSAYAFVRSGSTWTQEAKLAAGRLHDQFGLSVSLSSDGNTALIGAKWDATPADEYAGSAYVFVRSGGSWSQQAQLTAGNGRFGSSVSLCSDGNTAIVGAVSGRAGLLYGGSAYLFTRSGGTWSQQAELTPSDGTRQDAFGRSVSLSGDANMALAGAETHDTPAGYAAGSAYVFRLLTVPEGYNRLSAERLGGGAVRLTYIGLPGTNYALDHTFNLNSNIVWVPQVTNPAPPDGSINFTTTPDPTTNHFWRMRSVP